MKDIMNILIVVLLVILWILPVVLGIQQAKKKNRSAHWMWFGIHPISGWIVYFVLLSSKPLRICQNCKEKLKVNAKNCPYCEHKFESTESVLQISSSSKKWLRPTLIGLAALVAMTALFVLVFQLVNGMFTNSDPYKLAIDLARKNQVVKTEIGSDFQQEGFISGSASFSGAEGNAQMAIPVKGVKGNGIINLVAEERAGKWVFSTLNFNHNGNFVDLLAK